MNVTLVLIVLRSLREVDSSFIVCSGKRRRTGVLLPFPDIRSKLVVSE
jgi:hypothetical protein